MVGYRSVAMAKQKQELERKLFGVRMERALMVQLQHLATDEDKYVNELLEEAARDLLKKYREKNPKKGAE